jgi:hypothetical protein
MVIATSGSSSIIYNQIISSSAAPNYAVSSTKSFKDPKLFSNLELRGLYIIDRNNAISLNYETSTRKTFLATINFQAPSISY